jgi:hypothetical protein
MNKDVIRHPERLPSTNSGGVKITRSFRLTPESIDLIQQAAAETGAAQGDILEECILNAIEEVKERLTEKAKTEQEQRDAALARINAAKRGPGRPRKDSTRSKESPTAQVLKKRSQS